VNLPSAPGSDQEFLELLVQARQGDNHALGILINRYRPYLLKIAGDEADTELQAKEGESDLVQDAYLNAVRAFPLFKGQTQHDLRAWLRRILLNQISGSRAHYHADKRAIDAEIPLQTLDGNDSRNDNLAANISTPSEQFVRAEERRLFELALQTLPDIDRAVIAMRQKDGCPFAEIARRLNMTEDTAQKRWVRAIRALEEKVNRLDEHFPR
jgi:RNA polymerase sigma-70 factor (ECF subfamily)